MCRSKSLTMERAATGGRRRAQNEVGDVRGPTARSCEISSSIRTKTVDADFL